MVSSRHLVTGAVILECILLTCAAAVKAPTFVEQTSAGLQFPRPSRELQESFVGRFQPTEGSVTDGIKTSLFTASFRSTADPRSSETARRNSRVVNDAADASYYTKSLMDTLEQEPLAKQDSEQSDVTDTSTPSRNVNYRIFEPKVNDSTTVEEGRIISVNSNVSSEKVEEPAGGIQQTPAITPLQPFIGRSYLDLKIGQSETAVDSTQSNGANSDLEAAITKRQDTELSAETRIQGSGDSMDLMFYKTDVNDRRTTKSPKQVMNVPESMIAESGVIVTENGKTIDTKHEEVYAKNDGTEDIRSRDFEMGTAASSDSTHILPDPTTVDTTEVSTNRESFTETFTYRMGDAEETLSDMKPISGGLLNTTFYHSDTDHLSDDDNEIQVNDFNGEVDTSVNDCSRPCILGAPPRVCKYTFNVEWYHTMSKACFGCPRNASDCDRPHCIPADGIERPVTVVNRQMPGPAVDVCLNDIVQVDVVNRMTEETTSVHWHGQHQRLSPHMDGVPFVTQCPIGPNSAFRYRFVAATPGTHFWHSHTGCQRADGHYGALIVRTPLAVDPHAKLYDEEGPVLQVADWGKPLGVDKFANHHHAAGDNKPTAILVNGRGGLLWAAGRPGPPPAVFTVQKGKRYRFRVINNGFLNCPIQLSIDGHKLLVISSDGADINPIRADSLVTYAGERWDFVLEASAAVSSYWLRLRGLMDCGASFKKVHQVAVVCYEGAALGRPAGKVSWEHNDRPGLSVNTLNVGPGTRDARVVSELAAVPSVPDDIALAPKPDHTFYLGYDFYAIDNPHFHHPKLYNMNHVKRGDWRLFTPQLNHISMRLPPFPLLSQFSELDEDSTCNETTLAGRDCVSGYCECLHMLRVPLGAVVEIVLVDAGNMYNANHPFHLHGHAFRVVAMGKLGTNTSVEEVRALDRAGGIHRKLHGAPVKDTVTVPDGGFTILRVHANNPGYWLFHCHIEFHVEVGMAVVFKVGEHSEFPAPPPGFPQCNSWLPPYPSKAEVRSRLTAVAASALHREEENSSAAACASASALLLASLVQALK